MKNIKIELQSWDYTCGDGCCTDYGTKIFLNGKEIEHHVEGCDSSYLGDSVPNALKSVLKELGYNVEIVETIKS